MTKQEKLRELLKTVPAIKEDLEQLRFGCVINGLGHSNLIICGGLGEKRFINHGGYRIDEEKISDIKEQSIVGNPLCERHLRMYCKEKGMRCLFGSNGLVIIREANDNYTIDLDDTKPFDKQDEKVYEDIFNFLNK